MAVTEHNRIRPPEVDAELGVMLQRHAQAGVKQHAVRARFQPIGEAMLSNSLAPRTVFSDRRVSAIIAAGILPWSGLLSLDGRVVWGRRFSDGERRIARSL